MPLERQLSLHSSGSSPQAKSGVELPRSFGIRVPGLIGVVRACVRASGLGGGGGQAWVAPTLLYLHPHRLRDDRFRRLALPQPPQCTQHIIQLIKGMLAVAHSGARGTKSGQAGVRSRCNGHHALAQGSPLTPHRKPHPAPDAPSPPALSSETMTRGQLRTAWAWAW